MERGRERGRKEGKKKECNNIKEINEWINGTINTSRTTTVLTVERDLRMKSNYIISTYEEP